MDLGIRCNVSSERNNHRPKNKTALKYLYLRGDRRWMEAASAGGRDIIHS